MKLKKQPIVVISENNGIIHLHTTGAITVDKTSESWDSDVGEGRFMIYRKDLKEALEYNTLIQLYSKDDYGVITGPEEWITVTVEYFDGEICGSAFTRLRIGCTYPRR